MMKANVLSAQISQEVKITNVKLYILHNNPNNITCKKVTI